MIHKKTKSYITTSSYTTTLPSCSPCWSRCSGTPSRLDFLSRWSRLGQFSLTESLIVLGLASWALNKNKPKSRGGSYHFLCLLAGNSMTPRRLCCTWSSWGSSLECCPQAPCFSSSSHNPPSWRAASSWAWAWWSDIIPGSSQHSRLCCRPSRSCIGWGWAWDTSLWPRRGPNRRARHNAFSCSSICVCTHNIQEWKRIPSPSSACTRLSSWQGLGCGLSIDCQTTYKT